MTTAIQLEEEFEQAQVRIKQLKEAPAQDDMLSLYGYFKQATDGDCTQSKPSMFNIRAFAKHQAWTGYKGMSKEEAMEAYIKLVNSLTA